MRTPQSPLCTVDQVRSLEQGEIASGRSGQVLMESAGRAAFRVLRQRWPRAQCIAVYCGTGNNGGDGYVLARIASSCGLSVRLVSLGTATTPEARLAEQEALSVGLIPESHSQTILQETEVVVDALLGIGVSGNLREPLASIVDDINQYGGACLALDIPSGLNADTGAPLGSAVSADVTVTFIRNKPGLVTGRGVDYAGEVVIEDLRVSEESSARVRALQPWGFRISESWVRQVLPVRLNSAHKGVAGRLLVVGGGPGMAGAPVLAGCAALRMGSGRVSIACHPDSRSAAAALCPELMVNGVTDPNELTALLEGVDAVVVGPGLGQTVWASEMYSVCRDAELPKVVDADGLNLLAQSPTRLNGSLLTPHPGEAGRLAGLTTKEVQGTRPMIVEHLASKFDATCVLKGSGTLVAKGDHPVMACDRGHSGMATPGMGDVLSGVIGALRVQGVSDYEAAGAGVWLHAVAAERAGAAAGAFGMAASDLNPYLRELRSELSVGG